MQAISPNQNKIAVLNGKVVTNEDILHQFRITLKWQNVVDAIKNVLLDEILRENNIAASDEEISQYMEFFRRKHNLFAASTTEKWLMANYLTDYHFSLFCQAQVKLAKLKELLFEDKIERTFAFRKAGLEGVELYRIITKQEEQAEEILSSLEEGTDFFTLAKLYSQDEETRRQCGYAGITYRFQLRAEIEAAVFSAKVGQVTGPIKSTGRYHLYFVEKFYPAELNENVRQLLLEDLFNEWFESRFKSAEIEWLI